MPLLPMVMAIFILVLLLSFNRTMNRLTKPVSYLLILSILIPGLISSFYLLNKIEGIFYLKDYIEIFDKTDIAIHLNALNEKIIIIFALIISSIIGISIIKLPRGKGYVSYMVGVGLLSSTLLFAILFFEF